jgi:hypothetical protein
MNPAWFGDSYDLVKRFFVGCLQSIGYDVEIDPVLTGDWDGKERDFYKLTCTIPIGSSRNRTRALLLDPDTGIGTKRTEGRVTMRDVMDRLSDYDIVVVFDQSFSRGTNAQAKMIEKLNVLPSRGYSGFYYDSHARFLFAGQTQRTLDTLRSSLIELGLPAWRMVRLPNSNSCNQPTERSLASL